MDFTGLGAADFVIQLHVLAALCAAVLGPVALLRRRRDRVHRLMGYVWIIAMAVTALSSFLILELRLVGPFSPIHILSVVTLLGLVGALRHAWARNFAAHKAMMWRLYWQGIGLAGLFSFLPGRVMNDLFVLQNPWVAFAAAVAVFVLAGAWVFTGFRKVGPVREG